MIRNESFPVIFALTGIDGTGKSTIHRRLQIEFQEESSIKFVFKKDRSCYERLVRLKTASSTGDERELRWAHAFDFLTFYENEVLSSVGKKIVVSDRWSICSVAYAAVGPEVHLDIFRLLECTARPDFVVHLEGEPEICNERIRKIRSPTSDESVPSLVDFKKGYEKAFDLYRISPVLVEMTTHEQAYAKVRDLLKAVAAYASS